MRPGIASRARQILLLCALTLSVLGMHHVAAPSHAPGHSTMTAESMSVAAPGMAEAPAPTDPGNGVEHDLLHLCFVVLGAAAVVLLATWLLATIGATRASLTTRRRPSFPRLPSTAGRSLLTSVCVLRQ